jgi:hypothetical protein
VDGRAAIPARRDPHPDDVSEFSGPVTVGPLVAGPVRGQIFHQLLPRPGQFPGVRAGERRRQPNGRPRVELLCVRGQPTANGLERDGPSPAEGVGHEERSYTKLCFGGVQNSTCDGVGAPGPPSEQGNNR